MNEKMPRPTDGELEILRVLWAHGPCTVRFVRDVLNERRPTGYTTALKLLQIMFEKGLVERDERERTHVYRPAASQAAMQGRLVGDLLERAFGGSVPALVMRALSDRRATPDELAEIRRLLDGLGEPAL